MRVIIWREVQRERESWIEAESSKRQSLSGIHSPITSILCSLLCFRLFFHHQPFLGHLHFKASFTNTGRLLASRRGTPCRGGRKRRKRRQQQQHPALAAIINIHTEFSGLTSAGSRDVSWAGSWRAGMFGFVGTLSRFNTWIHAAHRAQHSEELNATLNTR